MPITLKETVNIVIVRSKIINGKEKEPLKQETEKVKSLEMKTKSKKVLRQKNG